MDAGWLAREGEGPATVFQRTPTEWNSAKPGQIRLGTKDGVISMKDFVPPALLALVVAKSCNIPPVTDHETAAASVALQ